MYQRTLDLLVKSTASLIYKFLTVHFAENPRISLPNYKNAMRTAVVLVVRVILTVQMCLDGLNFKKPLSAKSLT